MKYIPWSFALALLALLPVHGQNAYMNSSAGLGAAPSGIDPNSIITIKSHVNEINVLFIAMDKHGKFVRDLNQKDFSILDDHKPPQSIIRFSQETDLPLQIGLLIDTNSSIHSRFQFEQDAAAGFLQHTIRP